MKCESLIYQNRLRCTQFTSLILTNIKNSIKKPHADWYHYSRVPLFPHCYSAFHSPSWPEAILFNPGHVDVCRQRRFTENLQIRAFYCLGTLGQNMFRIDDICATQRFFCPIFSLHPCLMDSVIQSEICFGEISQLVKQTHQSLLHSDLYGYKIKH